MTFFCLILLFSNIGAVYAGNPRYMKSNGTPLTWDNTKTIKYKIDPVGLGRLNYDQSLALVQSAMSVWENVEGTGIRFEYLGPEDADITKENEEDYWNRAREGNYVVIMFDNVGNMSSGIGNTNILGVDGDDQTPLYFSSGSVRLNGQYLDGDESNEADISLLDMMGAMVHELGHLLGLDHSTLHYDIYYDVLWSFAATENARYLPTMFPFLKKGAGEHLINLHPDDIATFKWMYGASDVTLVSGNVYDADISPVRSMNVTVRNISSPLCLAYNQVTGATCSQRTNSLETGTLDYSGIYCLDAVAEGKFVIPVLNGGEYTVDVGEIPSSIENSIHYFYDDQSIVDIPGGAEFYNNGDTIVEDSYFYDVINLNDDLNDVNIVLSSCAVSENRLQYIEYAYFEEGESFGQATNDDEHCPIDNYINVAELIGAEEIVNDGQETNPANNDYQQESEETTTGSSGGCSLRDLNTQQQGSSTMLVFIFLFVSFLRLKHTYQWKVL